MSFPLQPGWLSKGRTLSSFRTQESPFLGGISLMAVNPGGTRAFPTRVSSSSCAVPSPKPFSGQHTRTEATFHCLPSSGAILLLTLGNFQAGIGRETFCAVPGHRGCRNLTGNPLEYSFTGTQALPAHQGHTGCSGGKVVMRAEWNRFV